MTPMMAMMRGWSEVPAPNSTESLSVLAAAAVAGDPALQKRVRKMVERIIGHVDFTLAFGKSDEKTALMKAVVPAMMRSLATVDDDASARGTHEAHERLMEAMGGDA